MLLDKMQVDVVSTPRTVVRFLRYTFSGRTVCVLARGAVAFFAAMSSSCGSAPHVVPESEPGAIPLVELSRVDGRATWQGLTRAVNMRVGSDGRVWIADNDARAILVFDSVGAPLGRAGSEAHLGFMSDFVVLDSSIVVLDTARTLSSLSLAGSSIGRRRDIGYEQVLGVFGADKVLMASSVRWTGPERNGMRPWPLVRMVTSTGDSLLEFGRRSPAANPFVAHITNFAMPAGSGNKPYVWLAFLNNSDVVLFGANGRLARRIARTIPFDWNAIPASFVPRSGARRPVFDGISYSVASDTSGTAYVLTALGPLVRRGEPSSMGVDVLSIDSRVPLKRFGFTGTATHVGISPSGSRLYLLDTHHNTVRTFVGPR